MNKIYCLGVAPFIGAGLAGQIAYFKPTDLGIHMRVGAVVVGLGVLTNVLSMQAGKKIPDMEERLIDKYVMPLDDLTLSKYA